MKVFYFYSLLLLFLTSLGELATARSFGSRNGTAGYPVILIPGDGGAQLEAKLNKPSAPHDFCIKKSDWFAIWVNFEELTPLVVDCFADNMRLLYNNQTRMVSNNTGVDIRVPGFGNTTTIEYLSSPQLSLTSYFAQIVTALVQWGYQRGVSVRGAPFDFRLAPNQFGDYYAALQRLIEETYLKNGGRPVVLVAHSLGNPTLLYFLNKQSANWKQQYVRAFVSLAGVWGGAVKTLRLFASGDNIGIFVVRPLSVRAFQRSMPSTAFLMPSDRFWGPSEVLVSTPTRNYTSADYVAFFNALGIPDAIEIRKDTGNLIADLVPPYVEFHALHGVGVKTPSGFRYTADQWPDKQPLELDDDGDGTVNYRSLKGYRAWIGKQPQGVFEKEFPGADHMAILAVQGVIDYLKTVVFPQ